MNQFVAKQPSFACQQIARVQRRRAFSTANSAKGHSRQPASNPAQGTQTRQKSTTLGNPVVLPATSAASSSSARTLWDRYTAALLKNPLLVKGSTASLIFFASDSATQYLTEPDTPYDVTRASSGAAFGVVATFWLHYWWNFLEGFIGNRIPVQQAKLINTMVKVVLDQALAAPCYIYGYYVVTNFIQDYNSERRKGGKDAATVFQETTERAGGMLLPTMLRHWTLWPAVHTLNFYFNPLHHRVLVQNLVLVGWSGYLSHLNNGGLMTPQEEIKVAIKRHATLQAQEQ